MLVGIYVVVVVVCSLSSLGTLNVHINRIHVPKLFSRGADRRLPQRREYVVCVVARYCRTRQWISLDRLGLVRQCDASIKAFIETLDCSHSASCWPSSASVAIESESARSLVDAIDKGAHNVLNMMTSRVQRSSEGSRNATHGVYIPRRAVCDSPAVHQTCDEGLEVMNFDVGLVKAELLCLFSRSAPCTNSSKH